MSALQTFRLEIDLERYEPPNYFGTYVTRALAEQARDFLLEHWSADDSRRPTLEQCHIWEVSVYDSMPPFQHWEASAELENPAEVRIERMEQPTLQVGEPLWHLLEDPARFVRCPLQFIRATGATRDEALQRLSDYHNRALALGALDILATARDLKHQAAVEAQRRFNTAEPDRDTGYKEPPWSLEPKVLDELALAHWGPGPHSAAGATPE